MLSGNPREISRSGDILNLFTGYVTTFKPDDLPTLKHLLSQSPELITQAGLHPTADQIELYAYHLPQAPLSDLMDIFVSLCTVDDSLYFMCNVDDFKFLAGMIEHVPLPLRARYVFCCAPMNRKLPLVCTMFLKFARQYCRNEPITSEWLQIRTGWPLAPPRTLIDLIHLEAVFDVLDLYLWLSYRFPDLFSDADGVKNMQRQLDVIIQNSIYRLTKLLKNPDPGQNYDSDNLSSEEESECSHERCEISRGMSTQNFYCLR
ncbi:hypothetical protein QAD02_021323 [Eretmocerus hayati]|uniref:Uncharacterized protein n=1 Tax=Eretmocerus hayati TaxID=131215 RepID=A0ACC2PUR5_9HYME|nr:hypothetical protein QAD02_021323 [Eretmocerus hayati]